MFAAGGKKGKGADKEGAARFKKDIITYKNQALQPVSCVADDDISGRREGEKRKTRWLQAKLGSTCDPAYVEARPGVSCARRGYRGNLRRLGA